MRTAPHGLLHMACAASRTSGVFSRPVCFPVGRVFPSGVLFHIAACFLHDIRLLIYIKRPVPPSPIGAAHRFLFCYKYGSGRISASLAPFFLSPSARRTGAFSRLRGFSAFLSFPRNIFSAFTRIFGFSSLFRVNHWLRPYNGVNYN